jgi:small subunit ribosomal protein S16
MIKLRLKRFGKKREVSYRIVAMKSSDRRDGRPLEELGFYNPRTDETRLNVDAIVRRLQQGAQPTDTVRHILERASILERPVSKYAPKGEAAAAVAPVATEIAAEATTEAAPEAVTEAAPEAAPETAPDDREPTDAAPAE